MAVYSSRIRRTIHHEWTVPVNTNAAELGKALSAAAHAYRTYNAFPETYELSDDALWVTSDGEEIVIYFTTEES